MKRRKVETRPAFTAAYSTLSQTEQARVKRVLKLLEYSSKSRPAHLSVFKSKGLSGYFIVRATRDLRLIYSKPEPRRIVVVDLYRRTTAGGAK